MCREKKKVTILCTSKKKEAEEVSAPSSIHILVPASSRVQLHLLLCIGMGHLCLIFNKCVHGLTYLPLLFSEDICGYFFNLKKKKTHKTRNETGLKSTTHSHI